MGFQEGFEPLTESEREALLVEVLGGTQLTDAESTVTGKKPAPAPTRRRAPPPTTTWATTTTTTTQPPTTTKVETTIKPKKKKGGKALIEVPDDDGILSLVQASQGIFLDNDDICVTAKKGDQAPVNGQFDGREVASGSVAMESGTFCVDKRVMALVQRSWGLHSAQEVEEVVKKKSKADKKKAKDAKVKAVDSGKESAEEAKAEEKAAVKEGKITAEEAKKDEKKVEKATAAKKKM